MSNLKSVAGWVVRGGEQARAEFASQAAAIQDLQEKLAAAEARLDQESRLEAELREVHADLVGRISAMTDRIDALEARCADQDAAITSLVRSVAPPAEG